MKEGNNMSEHKVVALYCRISKNLSGMNISDSIENQKQLLSKVALQYGYTRTRFFIDDSISGSTFDRPALKELEAAIQANQVCAVMVKDISRLGRDYLKVGYYLEQFFPQHNVRFIAVSGGIDSSDNSTDFVPLYSVMDEWYARDISRKIRLMYQARATAGIPVGTPIYGYKCNTDNPKQWMPDKNVAVVVQQIYQMAFCGHGTEQIARFLDEHEVLTPSMYHAKGRMNAQKGNCWSATTVAKILRDQRYCGDVVNLKTYSNSYKDKKRHINTPENMVVMKNIHEPIIERSLWEYIQCKLETRKTRQKAGDQSLFSGFLRCGDCGSNLHYHFNHVNPKIEYYNCSNYVGNRGTCPNTHYVRLDDLTDYVLSELNQLICRSNGTYFWYEIKSQKNIQAQKEITSRKDELKENAQRQKTISDLLRSAYEDKVSKTIDDEIFLILSDSYKKERGELRDQELYLQSQLDILQNEQCRMRLFQDELSEQKEIYHLTRDILGHFVDWISIYPADRSTKPYKQKIEIHYHFIGKL
jgi:site-specific DNA recombinase